MDILDISLAVAKVKRELEESRKIGKTAIESSGFTEYDELFEPNEELGGLSFHQYIGTLGVKITDLEVSIFWDGQIRKYEMPTGFSGSLYLGDKTLVGSEGGDNAPYCFIIDFDYKTTAVVAETPGNHHFAIARTFETTHPIDPKFLTGVTIRMLKSVLDFGSEQITNGTVFFLSDELVAELNTAPDAFMIRCKRTADDVSSYSMALFTPMTLEGVATGYNAVFVFFADYTVYSATIVNMGGEWMCQIGVSE